METTKTIKSSENVKNETKTTKTSENVKSKTKTPKPSENVKELKETTEVVKEPETQSIVNLDLILAQKKLISAREMKGSKVKFLCTKTQKTTEGIIKGVRLDKRNNFIQYRIQTENGMYGKGIDSKDLEFID